MYLEAKLTNPDTGKVRIKWLTKKGWMNSADAWADDVYIKEWKQKAAIIKAAKKELEKHPNWLITVKK